VAQVDSDALYRWRALFKRKGVSISENLGAAAVSFAAVQVSDSQPCGGTGVTVYVGAVLRLRCPSLEVRNSRTCRGSLSERSALRLTHDCGDTCRGGLLPRFRGRQAVGATSPKINSSNPRGHVLARNFQN